MFRDKMFILTLSSSEHFSFQIPKIIVAYFMWFSALSHVTSHDTSLIDKTTD